MLFSFTAASVLEFIVGIAALIIAAIIWTRRPTPGALPFVILMLCVTVWIGIRAFDIAAVDLSVKIFFGKLLYFAACAVSIMWLFFALDYIGKTWWRRPGKFLLFLIIPFLTLVVILTGQWHGWDWLRIHPNESASSALLLWSHGPMFWIQVIYIYSLFLTGIVLLWHFVLTSPEMNRWKVTAILISTLLPIAGHTISFLGYSLGGIQDFTPYALIIAGIIYTVTIFRFKFLDIVPMARTALIENMQDGIVVLDAKGYIFEINPIAARIGKCSKISATGKRLEQVWPELDRIVSQTDWVQNIETSFKNSEKILDFEINLTSIYNKQTALIGHLIVLKDITERNLNQRKLETLYQEEHRLRSNLEEEITKRNVLTSALVHELNTPLTAILASSELLESASKENMLPPLFDIISRSSLFLKERINDLLELAHGEAGALILLSAPLDMSKLIREVINDMSIVAKNRGIPLVSDTPELPLVLGDSKRIRQVLISLISNALKYTSKGQVVIKASKYNDETLLVQVNDTGCGIDKERIEYLFNPYRRVLTDGEKLGGIGIGLALSKIIVELHGGKIWVESTPGVGSSFYFTVPLYNRNLIK